MVVFNRWLAKILIKLCWPKRNKVHVGSSYEIPVFCFFFWGGLILYSIIERNLFWSSYMWERGFQTKWPFFAEYYFRYKWHLCCQQHFDLLNPCQKKLPYRLNKSFTNIFPILLTMWKPTCKKKENLRGSCPFWGLQSITFGCKLAGVCWCLLHLLCWRGTYNKRRGNENR